MKARDLLREGFRGLRTRIATIAPWFSLGFGLWSAFGVVRRYEQARSLAWMIAGIWLVALVLPVLRGRAAAGSRWIGRGEFALTWLSQSLSQNILFFVLPFWARSTTWDSPNAFFTALLFALAASTLVDPLYLGMIASRTRLLLVHKALVAFAGLAFAVPVLGGMHTGWALCLAGAASGCVAGLAGSSRSAIRRLKPGLMGVVLGGVFAFAAQGWIAPVPLRLESAVFASGMAGRIPSDTLRTARPGAELWAWTPVFAPSGLRDTVVHRWTKNGRRIAEVELVLRGGRKEGFRTWSSSRRAGEGSGDVAVEVWTSGGQLVGKLSIPVK